jgi:hypothetical protein
MVSSAFSCRRTTYRLPDASARHLMHNLFCNYTIVADEGKAYASGECSEEERLASGIA